MTAANRREFSPEARERLTMWATENYKHERARFPFGVYANPTALRADILSALAEIERLYGRQLELLMGLVSHSSESREERESDASDRLFANLTLPQYHALRMIVEAWIGEGFTTPPYTDEQYDIFKALDLATDDPYSYDTRRPG